MLTRSATSSPPACAPTSRAQRSAISTPSARLLRRALGDFLALVFLCARSEGDPRRRRHGRGAAEVDPDRARQGHRQVSTTEEQGLDVFGKGSDGRWRIIRFMSWQRPLKGGRAGGCSLAASRFKQPHSPQEAHTSASRGARRAPGVCQKSSAPKKRAWGMPGAQCTRRLVCLGSGRYAHELYRSTGITRHSRTQWFTVIRALPGDRAFLPPSFRGTCFRELDASVEASGPHDFAVRFKRPRQKRHPRPPQPAPRP